MLGRRLIAPTATRSSISARTSSGVREDHPQSLPSLPVLLRPCPADALRFSSDPLDRTRTGCTLQSKSKSTTRS